MPHMIFNVLAILILIVVAIGNIMWLRYQRRQMGMLRHQNAQLAQQGEKLQTRLLQLKFQAVQLSTTLSEKNPVQPQLEKQPEQVHLMD
ncbi:hypothetical protein [Erwinia pyrifoliae]|uniref:Uncharacterized protein n=2 Tax=Erwinia pyrifoliae TaxID=79967 RepID=A0ABY5X731_ERWPY|nr:hypothetical protein [Erwinia pyrifoliae]MCT2386036.1 hypothetical protein [Erwinia pyrifoliae]MCU8588378.1 hypothetical protein [Erwinia pyrifoliae]UWS29877.1 hypothetical protein NYP81_18850 [Erwinia pyrifoliae]UWS33099.1 hypothetical protein NYP84_16110 [Erwinia pyrifoliae]UXK12890.1 hypothetical protein NYP80_03050 [Erwinia pyrifoliae]